ncbi:RrF2 family transcriptional regulator [Geopsychrobacter electrodiphilus]|uniref:RrF2 family transcriptional regulator n=1 Tax=Geopsychrobacter electrodiphilus TaxID=225196 RepID=UPI0003741508|nr:Rrf2 family transcriptional regulator [Geopsychrobacter electrodiphilus]
MKLSTKSRYGVRAMFDMAYHTGTLPAQIKDISRRQNISPRYLEQIFQDLKKAGLLNSRRGPQGGYSLARPAEEITVKDIVLAAEGELQLVNCVKGLRKTSGNEEECEGACQFDNRCVTQDIWSNASKILGDYFETLSLKSLCDQAKEMGLEKELDHRFMYFI